MSLRIMFNSYRILKDQFRVLPKKDVDIHTALFRFYRDTRHIQHLHSGRDADKFQDSGAYTYCYPAGLNRRRVILHAGDSVGIIRGSPEYNHETFRAS